MLELNSFEFYAMGSFCNLHIYATDHANAEAIAQSAISEVYRIQDRYSRYIEDSFLSQINRIGALGGAIEVDEETAGLLDYVYACHQKSGGLFDITSGILRKAWDFSLSRIPEQSVIDGLLPLVGLDKIAWVKSTLLFSTPGMELDFGGIGKEYAADQVAAVCVSLGIEHGLVDLGGDICVVGPHPSHEPWHIEIRHPRKMDTFMATIDVERGAIASSGDYERFIEVEGKRYCHIINPLTGWPVRGLSSVSVLAEQCMVAGSVSTIAMLRGLNGRQWLNELGVQYVSLDEEDNLEGTTPFLVIESS